MSGRRGQFLLLAGLLTVTLGFGLGILPLGIAEGYGGSGPGLSPRTMPQLAVAGIALSLMYGLLRNALGAASAGGPDEMPAEKGAHPLRALGAILTCLVFAHLGFAALGFYLGGVIMAALLSLLLGERQPFKVVVVPVLILTAIYGVFELGFQIRLPKADLIPGLPL